MSTRSAPTLRKCASASFNTGLMFNLKNTEDELPPSPNFKNIKDKKQIQRTNPSFLSQKRVKNKYELSLSCSNGSFFNDNLVCINRSKSSLSDSIQHSLNSHISKPESCLSYRPQSLYVPFLGRVETPPHPPGKEARDILMALSYPPIQDDIGSFQYQAVSKMQHNNPHFHNVCHNEKSPKDLSSDGIPRNQISANMEAVKQTTNESCDKRHSCGRYSSSYDKNSLKSEKSCSHQKQILNKSFESRYDGISNSTTNSGNVMKKLSYSTADITKHPVISCQPSPIPPLSPFVNAKRSDSVQYSSTHDIGKNILKQDQESQNLKQFNPPLFSPTHPLNHSENTVIRVCHPPVLYPPLNLLRSNFGDKDHSSQLDPQIDQRRKSFVFKSISNCSTISQNSHSSSSGEQGSYETAKSISSISSFSSSSIASNHNYHCSEQNLLPFSNQSPSNVSLTTSNSSIPQFINQVNQSKNQCQSDNTKLESIREASPFSINLRH